MYRNAWLGRFCFWSVSDPILTWSGFPIYLLFGGLNLGKKGFCQHHQESRLGPRLFWFWNYFLAFTPETIIEPLRWIWLVWQWTIKTHKQTTAWKRELFSAWYWVSFKERDEVSKEEREMYKAKQNLWYELRHPVQVLACPKVPPPHPSLTPSHT